MASGREIHTATVQSNEDPKKRGRIKVSCEAILGDDQVIDVWIPPSSNSPGWFFVPEVSDTVEIEINQSDDTEITLNMKYRAVVYNDDSEVNEVFKRGYQRGLPKRMGIVTPAGHMIIFDNGDDPTVNVVHGGGAFMRLNADKSWNVGQDWENNKELVFIEVDKDGNVGLAKGALAGTHVAVLGDLLATLFDTHTHPTGVGSSGPPIIATTFKGVKDTPADPLSKLVKIGPNS